MSIAFVSTSVLESKDGIDFGIEKRQDTDEVKEAERLAAESLNRPLFEQLQDRADKKAEEFEAVRKTYFAPTKGLDEEDVEFLEGVEETRKAAKVWKQERESKELDAYAEARHKLVSGEKGDVSAQRMVVGAVAATEKKKEDEAPPIVVRKKRKDEGEPKKKHKKKKEKQGEDKAEGLGGLLGSYDDSE